jgi:hypothetical protein
MKTWEKHVKHVLSFIGLKNAENNLVFLKSWNEWAEGNYMEPDMQFQNRKLEILKKYLK